MNVFREKTTKQLLAKLMIFVIFTVMCLFLAPVLLPGNQGEALAAEPYDSLAKQAVSNSYNRYLETEGKVVSSSLTDLDSYSIYILTEANVSVDQWVYGESRLKTTVINLIDDTIENEADESVNAKHVACQYLAAKGLGEDALAQKLLAILKTRQENNEDGTFCQGEWSQFTNLPVFDALRRGGVLGQTDVEKGIDYILSLKAGDYFFDFMSTTQAIRSLSALKAEQPKYRTAEIETAINEGLAWLQEQIKEDGSVVYVGDGWSEDAVTDTVECILTLVALGQDPHSWQHETTGKSPVDYMREKAKNADGTFGCGNMGANTWALDAFNCLGASIAENAVIGLSITPENIELAVGEEQEFRVTAFLINGTTTDVTTRAAWSVNDSEIVSINTDDKVVVKRIAEGDFEVEASYQLVNCKVIVGTSVDPRANITLRIEGPEYTILPDTVITVPISSGYMEVLRAGQSLHDYLIEENEWGYVDTINGLGTPDFFWRAAPYQAVYQDGEAFVMSGNGSTNLGKLVLSTSETKPGVTITVTVTKQSDEPIEEAKVIYYTSEKRTTPTTAGYTDANGQLKFSIGEKGTYFVAADKPNTSTDWSIDNGLVRTVAPELLVRESSSSGGGGGSSRPSENKVRVKVTVTGEDGERLFAERVKLDKKKATVFEALVKTGLSYEGDSYFITAIEGQKNRGMNGWMVKVNGKFIATSIGDYTLRTGDSVEWLYSTDSSNIVGVGGKSGGSGSSSLYTKKSSEVEKSTEEVLTELLAQGDELKVNLQKIVNQQAFFSPQLLAKVREQEKGLQLETEKMQVSFASSSLWTEQLSKACAEENILLNLGAKALSATEKKEIIEGALRPGCGLEDIGAQVVELKAEIVRTEEKEEVYTETITGFSEPVQITLDLSGLEIAEEDVNLLTAVRYVKDRWGNWQPVKLGGTYDVTSEKFTFYTENFSLYSVVKAEDLLKIVLVIDEPEVLVNDTKKNVDVPACLIENRTMVPLRFVAEGMGAEVEWEGDTKTVEMHFQDKLLKLVVGKTGLGLEVPALIEEGRTLVPLRYVVNYLGATVTWFPATQTVMIVR